MSDLEMRHLESFLAVAEECSFTQAALRLHITQPPLSTRIRELETMLKLRLFDRTTRQVRLTSAGQIFLEKLQVAMQALNTAVAAARQVNQGVTGKLRVGYTGLAGDSVLPRLIREFHSSYPNIALDIDGPSTSGKLGLSLLNNEIDCALCFLPLPDDRLQSRTLIVRGMALVLPSSHPLARAQRVSLQDVADEPFVTYPAGGGSHLRTVVDGACARAGFRPKIVRESPFLQTLLCLVAAGIGVSIVPKEEQKRGIEGVKFIALPNQALLHYVVACRKDDTNPCVNNFLAVAKKSFPPSKKSL